MTSVFTNRDCDFAFGGCGPGNPAVWWAEDSRFAIEDLNITIFWNNRFEESIIPMSCTISGCDVSGREVLTGLMLWLLIAICIGFLLWWLL